MKTILIVDDDENIRLLLRDEFADQGYNIITAVDGEEAVISFFEENVDLVILDVKMPKLDGKEVLEKIREKNKTVPIIMYTANPESISNIDSYGNIDIEIKSANLSLLVNKVSKTLNA